MPWRALTYSTDSLLLLLSISQEHARTVHSLSPSQPPLGRHLGSFLSLFQIIEGFFAYQLIINRFILPANY